MYSMYDRNRKDLTMFCSRNNMNKKKKGIQGMPAVSSFYSPFSFCNHQPFFFFFFLFFSSLCDFNFFVESTGLFVVQVKGKEKKKTGYKVLRNPMSWKN